MRFALRAGKSATSATLLSINNLIVVNRQQTGNIFAFLPAQPHRPRRLARHSVLALAAPRPPMGYVKAARGSFGFFQFLVLLLKASFPVRFPFWKVWLRVLIFRVCFLCGASGSLAALQPPIRTRAQRRGYILTIR
jgi:hypothetical protein